MALGVEEVVTPAQEVGRLKGKGGDPNENAGGDGGLGGEDLVVYGVVADEDEAIEGGQRQGQECAEARRQTNGGHCLTEPLLVVEPSFSLHHG